MNLRLAQKNKEANPQSWDELYAIRVHNEMRKRYSQDQVEAIINNYLDDPSNEKYCAEFRAMQDYRKQCKERAKEGIL